MKKLLLTLSIFCLLLASCGKPKIKTYTIAEKEAYLEKAVNGDKEAEKFIKDKLEETKKYYKETGDSVAKKEWEEWFNISLSQPTNFPVEELAW